MASQVRLPVLLLTLLLAVAALVGCGGGGGSGESATQVLDQTFGSGASVKSGRLTLALDADVPGVRGVQGPVSLKLTGPFQAASSGDQLPRFDFTLSLDADGQSLNAGAVSTGDQGFLRFEGTAYALPAKLFAEFRDSYLKAQRRSAAKQRPPSLGQLGIDPRSWLTNPQRQDDTELGGTAVTHVSAGLDVSKLLADVQTLLRRAQSVSGGSATPLTQAQLDQLRKDVESAKVDVYAGKDDHELRKLVVDLGLTKGRLSFTLAYDQLGQPQTIAAPSGAKPIQDLVAQLQGAAAAVSGAGSGSSGSSGSSATGGANQRYLQCVQDAGQDLAKVQACAKFL